MLHISTSLYSINYISADPGLCQGRVGAWDHRRCGTWLSGRKQRHTPSRQHLCQLHAPDIYHAPAELLHLHAPGRSRLPFARPQTLQTLPQASKATTLTATTCPCHLFFRGFKTAVCPPSNPPNASNAPAGLQGNNSYSYMPLPSVFQGVQDCRLPALKPPKRFQRSRRPPRQQLLQLHVPKPSKRFQPSRRPPRPCHLFFRGSRLPFARPQTPQTLPQASKATTLTAPTCPCHLFFRGFKTAVGPPSNPPNASNPPAGLQGNNSYSYMPLPSVFQGVQDCRLPALKPPKRFQRSRRPPRQQLLQLHVPKPSKRFQPSRRPPRPCHLFFRGSRLPFARPQTPQTLPQASKATTLTAPTCPCHLFFRGFKTAVGPPSNPPNASNPPAGLQGNNSYSYMPLPSVFPGVQDCRLPALKPPKRFQRSRRPPRQQLLQLHVPAICFSGGSRLPFARPQTPQTLPTLPQASKATTLTATCPCHLFFRGFKTTVCPPSNPPNASNPPAGLQGNNSPNPPNASNPLAGLPGPAICFSGVQDCRLPALKPPKRFRRPPRQQLLQLLHAPAICFSGGSRLPLARLPTPQTLPTLPQASKATTLTATCPCHLFFRGFKTAVCPPSNPPNASNAPAGLQGNNSYSYMSLPSVFQGVQDCRLLGLKPPKRFQPSRRPPRQQLLQLHAPAICFSGGSRLPFARPQTPQTLRTLPQASKATTLTATCPCHLFFRTFKTAVCLPNSYTYMPQDVQDCRLPGLKPSKRFRRPPRQQLLQLLHAPAICFSGGSRLPLARLPTPQTLPTLPQASKATTLTATCPCHLFFRGFKTAVCPPSNPPNASNAPAGLQGNNSYSYMPLPSVFQGVQDCRLPALKPPKRFEPSRRPPRQQLPKPSKRFQPSRRPPRPCHLFFRGSRLPFARPQTPQTLPQASKATTLTAPTCPCHLFFRGFKTAVGPPSNPPNASNPPAGLQGNNSYSYMPLPSVFPGVQDCRLPALKPPKRFQRSRRPPRQQLLQLHVPAICFSGGSRLPFARPQTPQTLPTLPQASKATTLTATCPCHLFFRGFKTAVCPPSNPPNASNPPAGLQGKNSPNPPNASNPLAGLPGPAICFSGVQDCRLPALKPPKRFRRPPRQQLLQLLHAPAICFSGGSRLPLARPQTPQTLPTLPQASKATTLTATCPCHLFFRGFKTAVCSASNPPNASNPPAGLQGNNSYSYMPLPSVFQGVQDCRLPALKPPKRFEPSRRPPRQQLLQLHVPAICFSGRSRLPFACRTLTPTCPRTFKTAVCPASNPPNASAGLQGNNSYSYMPLPSVFQGVQDCRWPAFQPPKRFQPSRRPPRQQLLQLHAPAICFSGGSRLPFARPQTPQALPTLPQASKATTLTATCPCHLFFRGFKTAVCPPSNPPNASNAPAGLQGNNSYSYMPLPSVFQGVQDCRLPALKPPKRFQRSRRPPRQQLLQLHVPKPSKRFQPSRRPPRPCHLFFRGSRLPFARPQTPQTLPQASKATTLTAPTCPCHLFFRGFKTAVGPPSNPPNASNPPAGLQGNNSYSYMPLPSVFPGVQDCRLPALKPPKRFQRSRRPPRQQLLQLHVPAICFSGGSRLPFARPQTPQTLPTLPQASKATTLTATCPCHLFFRGFKTAVCPPSNPPNASNPPAGLQGNNSYSYMSLPSVFQDVQDCRLPAELLHLHAPGRSRLPFARPQTLQTLPQASKATTLTATTCPCHLFFRGFKTAVGPPSNPPNASNPPAGLQGNNSYSYMPLPSVFQGVQDCRLPALKPPKRFQRSRRPPRQQLLQLHVPAICFSGGSRLPFARPQTPQTLATLPQASKATTLTATCPCHLFFRGFKAAVCPPSNPPNASNPPAGLQGNNSYSYMSLPSVFRDVQDCRLPAELLHLHAPGRSRLPFARPQTLQTLPQASKATTLTATTCPASNPPNASNPPAGLQGNNSYSYMPLPSVFQGVQDCRLPALKPPKRFEPSRRPPRQQLLQLHVPGRSRLPFARPQTLQTLPQASKATTLTATTCPCHLFFRGFKTAVGPPSNPPNASNPPAGLQGNNSYSYMPLPSVFQGVQDCRLPALKPPKRFQRSRRPPRQQLLQLHVPAICFSGGSKLPFARPQTPQTLPTLPQASKATTLTATCPCHLFFRGFKTAVCPPANPPNASNPPAGLQGNNSYSYMSLPSVFQDVQDCRLPAELLHLHAPGRSRLPFARPQTLQTLPQASKATTLTATTCPCHLFFRGFKTAVCPPSNPPNASNAPAGLQGNNSYSYMPLPSVFQGVQDCRLPALKPPKRFQRSRRPPRQQLLQLHVPKPSKRFQPSRRPPRPCHLFFRGSRLPFARPQTPQTLPQASKATSLTAPTCPCHLFFRGFKTAVGPPSNPPNASNPPAGLQGNNSYSYMPLPSVFQGVQDCRLPALKPPKRFQRSRRPPRQQLLQLHAPAICFSGGSRLPFARPQTPQTLPTLPQASKATTLTATCPCHLFFRGFKTAVCPPSNPPNASNPPAGLQGNNSYSYMSLPSVFQDVQDCRLPAELLHLHAPGRSRLPFARPQTLQTLPQASKATTLTATCPCHLFFRGFKTAVGPPSNPPNASNAPAGLQGNNSYSYMSLPSVFQGVQDCRLPALKPPKRFQPSRRPPRQQLLQLHAPAICFSGGSRLPFARPQTPQMLRTLPQASKATTLTATCPCHLFFRTFKTAVCLPNSYTYMPQDVQDCRLPGLKPSKRFRRPPRQQLLQLLHAPAICFSGGSRLPLARLPTPQTLPTLPQASKATTLTATCPCHLFFRGFKTAVCPPSNPPNASNPPAGLQGNNSYSYMSLPSVFQGVQDCRLPALKPPKRFQPSRRPPRQQLLQLHVPAICFSGRSRLPFACRTLTPTCPRTFKTAVCPASNPPNASAGLQGNNSYSYYMPLPSVFQGVQDCRWPAFQPPKRFQPSRRPPRQQLVFQGVQDCRLPALKPPKRFQPSRRPPRQQLLQLHVPAICFSGRSRLPFARPQTVQTLPQASKATTLTAPSCPCHLFFRGFKTAVCPASKPPKPEPVIHRLLWGFCCGTNHLFSCMVSQQACHG